MRAGRRGMSFSRGHGGPWWPRDFDLYRKSGCCVQCGHLRPAEMSFDLVPAIMSFRVFCFVLGVLKRGVLLLGGGYLPRYWSTVGVYGICN